MRYMAIMMCLCAAGCLSRNETPIVRYVLEPPIVVAQAPGDGPSLALRALRVSNAYRESVAIYKPGQVLANSSTTKWAEPPAAAMGRALADALTATGRFSDVGAAEAILQPGLVLTGELRKFHLDKTASPWTAVCEARLELRTGGDYEVVWSGTLSAAKPLATDSMDALPMAMSSAVGDVASQAANAMAAAVK